MNENEKTPTGPTPEERERQEQEDFYKQWMLDHPEKPLPKGRRESGPEIIELEHMLESFLTEHSLEELHKIINLTPAEAPLHPLREPARQALIPIVKKLNALKEETDISPEKHDELKAKYMVLSRAVGMINNNTVDHNRLPDIKIDWPK